MEFLVWVDAVWGEEGHIRASILEKRNILPQHPVGTDDGQGATAD